MRITLVGSRHFGVTTLNMLRQHVQGGHAEMAGADEGNPHGGSVRPEP